ncbi:MAG: UDP-glucose/GDP-mannose dehydrogenase family protein, partial [Bacteroidota bacterium]
NVICIYIDKEKIKKLRSGKIPIYEPHLDGMFQRNIKAKRLSFTTNLKDSIEKSLVIFLALPTPPDENGSADLSHILNVSNELGKIIKEYKVVVNKSTVPVGTSELVRKAIAKNCKTEFDVVSNPEFLREGFAVDDFMKPDRVVVGTLNERAKKIMEELYKPFVRQGNLILFMDEKSSELTKYAANSFLATKISFMNEIANLCEKVGADVDKVRIGIGSDERIGKRFLFAGIGYGGSCFPKDVQALAKSSKLHKYDFKILKSVMDVNVRQRKLFLQKIKKYFSNNHKNIGTCLQGKKIAIWGLAFKPDTDDIRESPALYFIEEFIKSGASVSVYDPEAMHNVKKIFGDKIHFGNDHYEILKNVNTLVICTEWSVFRTPDFEKIKKLMKDKIIFDGRNLYNIEQMKQLGFYYCSIGRKTII